jgi:ribosomal-protein-alanine N-acetyltransferase
MAIVQWAMSIPSIWRVWATCDVENIASARCWRRPGCPGRGRLGALSFGQNFSSQPRDALIYARVRA